MKRLSIVLLACLVLPSFGMNLKERFSWSKIPKEFKSWNRIYTPQKMKYNMYVPRSRSDKDLAGTIEFSNFYIKVKEVYTFENSRPKKEDRIRTLNAKIQLEFDVKTSVPITHDLHTHLSKSRFSDWDTAPTICFLDKSGFSYHRFKLFFSDDLVAHLKGKTSGTIMMTTSCKSEYFEDLYKLKMYK